MTVTEAIINVLISTVGIMGLGWLYLVGYRRYRVLRLRQRLFVLRDELFEMGRSGVVSFDEPSYGLLRLMINGHIRFADRATLPGLLLFFVFVRQADVQAAFGDKWEAALARLPEDARLRMEDHLRRVHEVIVRHLLATSPVLGAIVSAPILALVLLAYVLHRKEILAAGAARAPIEAAPVERTPEQVAVRWDVAARPFRPALEGWDGAAYAEGARHYEEADLAFA